ncbi:class I SAM-dependent methyltransferase [Actinoplanes sp. TFC3]|uniref:class I SAM-dependent methyltransferase n=1 Tax=Actinoplanes sp. TFC3 TaxID=1710355 RepID=UPI000830DE74|nr:class I SAM-dependent methyltransferase [Actinoplanes sp. TFC3]
MSGKLYDWDETYRGADPPPWEIGRPQPALAELINGGVSGPRVLDLGCGTGELAMALARRGYDVTGVDISRVAIELAREKAAGAGLTVAFEVHDARRLELPSPFDSLFDCGLLHNLARAEGGNEAEPYLARLPGFAAPGASLYLLAVSAEAGPGWTITEDYLRTAFAEPAWTATTIKHITVDAGSLTLPGFLLQATRSWTLGGQVAVSR